MEELRAIMDPNRNKTESSGGPPFEALPRLRQWHAFASIIVFLGLSLMVNFAVTNNALDGYLWLQKSPEYSVGGTEIYTSEMGRTTTSSNFKWEKSNDNSSAMQRLRQGNSQPPGAKTPRIAESVLGLRYQPNSLEFVHIPKTGGTSVEAFFASTQRGRWGFCKFVTRDDSVKFSEGSVECPAGAPPLRKAMYVESLWKERNICHGAMPWHMPPLCFDGLPASIPNLYSNATLFAIVRNPYDRLISEYYYDNFVNFWRSQLNAVGLRPSPMHLNHWAQRKLEERIKFMNQTQPWKMEGYGAGGGHWIPQYDFCFGSQQQNASEPIIQRVHHILRFETLTKEFDALMDQFNYTKGSLPHAMAFSTKPKGGKASLQSSTMKKLTRNDLDRTNRELVELVYADDFKAFGYEKES